MVIDQTMSDFDQTKFQAKAFQEIAHIIQTKKIPNAILFFGKENTRRKEAAFLFAKGCNCQGQTGAGETVGKIQTAGDKPGEPVRNKIACNQCRSCRKIDAKSHPDILCVDLQKDKKIISISQIREMGLRISSRPNEARFRMVLILNADKMNTQAQNALLKMLEEPPYKTFFILIAGKLSLLLPTIISRCRKIRFNPLTPALIEQRLINDFKVDLKLARMASKTADADLKKAMMYLNLNPDKNTEETEKAKEVNWIKRRKWLLDSLSGIIRTDTRDCISKGLLLSHKLSCDPELVDDTIAIMNTFFRDLMIFKFHPQKIVNLDFFDTFSDINQMVSPNIFFEWIKDLYETEKKLAANATLRLTLDRFFLKIGTHKGRLIYD